LKPADVSLLIGCLAQLRFHHASAGEFAVAAELSYAAEGDSKLARVIPTTACLALLGTAALGRPMNLSSDLNANDSMYQELDRIVNAQSDCFEKEAQSSELINADLATAAHTVLVNCATETQRLKVYMANNFPGSPSRFEKWWSEKEQNTIEYVKKVIVVVRTQ
jgi:hypothetical protein